MLAPTQCRDAGRLEQSSHALHAALQHAPRAGAISGDGRSLTVAVINATESPRVLDLNYRGITLAGNGRLWRMTGPSLTSSTGLNRNEVQVTENAVSKANTFEIAPASVNIFAFAKQ